MTNKPLCKIGLIGAGFMGKAHANAFRAVGGYFDLPVDITLEMIADIDEKSAKENAEKLGFRRYTSHWQELVCDGDIDIVSITAPNKLHEQIAQTAMENHKVVYCEKPLSVDAASSRRMMLIAEQNKVITQVGFNFLRNPLIKMAKDMIDEGELGEITGFRGRHGEDYMANPLTPHSFRTDVKGGGALADIGSHIVSIARYLLGNIAKVQAQKATIYQARPIKAGAQQTAPVLVDDTAHALLIFERGTLGSIDVSWLQTGRTMDLSFEVTGTKGALYFTQERMNELKVWHYCHDKKQGFMKVETGPNHVPYGNFCPAAGHHLGFNDLKIIETAELIKACYEGGAIFTDFREGYLVQKTIDAMHQSAQSQQWVTIEEE